MKSKRWTISNIKIRNLFIPQGRHQGETWCKKISAGEALYVCAINLGSIIEDPDDYLEVLKKLMEAKLFCFDSVERQNLQLRITDALITEDNIND